MKMFKEYTIVFDGKSKCFWLSVLLFCVLYSFYDLNFAFVLSGIFYIIIYNIVNLYQYWNWRRNV